MPVLLLVRHGRSTSNTAGTLAGRTPGVHLDETGTSQAMAVGERLRGVELAAAVRSPVLRCQETLDLALASAASSVPVHVEERLTECDYGEWTNRELGSLAGEPLWATVQKHPSQVTFPGGEAMQAMAGRVVAAVDDWNARLCSENPDSEPVWLAVSHGDPIKAILSHALGQQLDDFQRIVVDPASVSIVRYPTPAQAADGAVPMVLAMNTTQGQLVKRLPQVPQGPGPQLGGGLGSQQS